MNIRGKENRSSGGAQKSGLLDNIINPTVGVKYKSR